MTSTLFVTGMQRSGTTLLEKLACNHPRISLLSQAVPLLFVQAKRDFLKSIGEPDDRYPLGALYLENRYELEDFSRFLNSYQIAGEALSTLFEKMGDFAGQYTRFSPEQVRSVLQGLAADGFAATATQLYRGLAHNKQADLVGGKETICEEFLPHLLEAGWKCLVVLRDPRDTLVSLNYGKGQQHAGRLKPTLFNLRNWRKSVAFALHLAGHASFAWVRYEDLVARPLACLNRIAAMLRVSPFTSDLFAEGIKDQSGGLWRGNSSHSERIGIDSSSVGIHKKLLPSSVRDYLEAACLPEMRFLGYDVSLDWAEAPRIISAYREPYSPLREELSSYVDQPSRVAEELRRVELLPQAATESTRPSFLFQDVHEALRQAVYP